VILQKRRNKGAVAGDHKPLQHSRRAPQRNWPYIARCDANRAPEVFVLNDTKGGASRKAAVLGPIPRDQIVTHTGERFHK
jgi:hypothetical protein